MKEINVFKNNPNGRNIIIPKKIKNDINILYKAMQDCSSLGEMAIYTFFYTYPESNIKIGFDKSLSDKMGIRNSARQEGFKKLVLKGYFIQINKTDYIFNEDKTPGEIVNFVEPSNQPKESKNIIKIKQMLFLNNLLFEEEVIFPNFYFSDSKRLGYYDLFIENKYVIEFDGEQHFKEIAFWGGQEGFNKRRKHDLEKNKYCFDNNIPLIRIPYDADYTIDDLKIETTRFLLTPENEEKYYADRS